MATKAVTLKNSNDDTVYPVTDISLVNGGIFADTIAPVEAGEQVETAMIADGAVTAPKIDASLMNSIEKNIMTIAGNYPDTQFSYNTTMQLNTLLDSTGTKLTFESASYGIKIGAGVSKVLVSASAFFSVGAAGYGWFRIDKNGSSTGLEAIAYTAPGSFGTATLCPVVLSVQENDVITVYNLENCRIRGTASYLTVEVIA